MTATIRTFFLVLVILIISTGKGLAQWEMTYGPTGSAFHRVSCFVKIGTNLFAGTEGDGVWISTDNSATPWTKVSAGLTGNSVTALLADGTNLIAGTDNGVFISTNNGANWTAINNGLTNTSVGSLALIGTNLFAGTLGSGVFLSTNNGASWTQVNNGLPGNAVSPLTACGTNLFAEVLGQGLYVSTNYGTSWDLAGTGLTSSSITALTSSGPNIFAGTSGSGVFLATNNDVNWNLASTGLPNSAEVCFAVSGISVFAGAYSNGVYLTTDNGANWNDVNDGFGTSRTIRCLAVLGDDLFAGFYNGEVRRRPLSQMISSTVSDLPIPIGVGSAEVRGNSIYYFGGSTSWSGSTRYPAVYKYDGDIWQYYDSMPDIDVWGISTTIIGDNAFVYGGYANGNNKLRIYNLVNKTWQYGASSPNISSSYGHTMEYMNGFIYLFFNGYVYKYNIGTNSWTQATTLSQNGSWLFSTVYQDEVYLTGWALGSFYKYNPASDQWTQLANLPSFVTGGALRCIDDKIYFVGGTTGSGAGTLNNTLVYDIATNQWSDAGINISANRAYMADVYYNYNFYVIGGLGSNGNAVGDIELIIAGTPTEVETENTVVTNFKLLQNYPNPFNPSTTIRYAVPNESKVSITVFNLLGQQVATLVNDVQPAGYHEVTFNASNLSSGVYLYRINAVSSSNSKEFKSTKKFILLK